MSDLTQEDIDRIAEAVLEKLREGNDVELGQEIIEKGPRQYFIDYDKYRNWTPADAALEIFSKYPYVEKGTGMRYGYESEWPEHFKT